MKGFHIIVSLFVIVFMGISQEGEVLARKNATKNPTPGAVMAKEPATITGFRSARFGMTQRKTLTAIRQDFNIRESGVKRENNPLERTLSLIVDVPDLLPDVGLGRVVYILGYQSKKLIQVNVIWGIPITPKPDAQVLVSTANMLRNHLTRKEYVKDSLAINQRLKDGSILVFKGADSNGRMVLLTLNNPPDGKKEDPEKTPKLSLRLSYIENPVAPDVFKLKSSDF